MRGLISLYCNYIIRFVLLFFFVRVNMVQLPFSIQRPENNEALISDYSFNPILLKICFGDPSTCYNLIYDTTAYYTYLCLDSCSMVSIGNSFNPSTSKTSKLIDKEMDIIEDNVDAFGFGYESQDKISFGNQSLSHSELAFIVMKDVYHSLLQGQADGVLGLHFQYSQIKYSFLHILSLNKLITSTIFAHKFNSPTQGIVYFGETGLTRELESHIKYCGLTNLSTNWECQIHHIALNNKVFDLHSENISMIFSTGSYSVEFPKGKIAPVLHQYLSWLNGFNCKIIKEGKVTKLICESLPSNLPSIEFAFENEMMFRISQNDLFTYRRIDQQYELSLVENENRSKAKLGLVAMKNYHMIFHYGKGRIGAIENREYKDIYHPPKYINMFLWVLLFVLLTILLLLLCICRSITKKSKGKDNITLEQIKEINSLFAS